jgi:hypothetical membrane protein
MAQKRTSKHGDGLTLVLGGCGILSVLMFVAADRAGAYLTPGYSSVAETISELVETQAPYKFLVTPFLTIFHGLLIPFAVGLHRALEPSPRGVAGPALLAIAGFAGVILTLFFPCDPGCYPPQTTLGAVHRFIAAPMGFSIVVAMFAFSRRFAADPVWSDLEGYCRLTAVTALVLAILTFVLARTDYVGLAERLLTYSFLQWYFIVGLNVVRNQG